MNKDSTQLFNSHLTLTGFEKAKALTIVSGDATTLEFTLKDKNNAPIELSETIGQAQIIDSDRNALVAVFDVQVEGSTATFSLDKAIPPDDYELYFKVGKHYFPSRTDSFLLRVIEAYDVVEDIDLSDVQTIDIVVDALKGDVIAALTGQIEEAVLTVVNADPDKFKGDKGDSFTKDDFTDEEWQSLKGDNGDSLTFDQLTFDQQEALRGHSAYQVAVNEGFKGSVEEWFATFKGDKGDTGDSAYEEAFKNGFVGSEAEWLESLNGLDGTVAYSDLDESQKAALRVPPKVYTRDEYNQLAVKDANTLYFIEEA